MQQQVLSTCLAFFMTQTFAASHHPQRLLDRIAGTKHEGAQIVEHYCANCHAAKPLIPVGAPRMGVAADWLPRMKSGQLFLHTDEGLGAMPSRGGCFECSDRQLHLAIEALLPQAGSANPANKAHKKNKK